MWKSVVLTSLALGASAAMAAPPEPVSPAGPVELRCPTFSWSAVAGADGYELVVYAVSGDGDAGDEPLVSARLPGGASSWTLPGDRCLAPGGRFAWSLRLLDEGRDSPWSDPVLFEVAAAPAAREVEAAIATLRRHLAEARPAGRGSEPPAREAVIASPPRPSEGVGSISAAAAPALGTPALTLDANVALGATSNLFKDGAVFLWDDTAGNTALGRSTLGSADGTATRNTAVGTGALGSTVAGLETFHGSRNTAIGYRALFDNTTGWANSALGHHALGANTDGSFNTASGDLALYSNTSGHRNTAIGGRALYSNTSGAWNTATGAFALRSNVTGSKNTAVGYRALRDTTGTSNVAIGYNAGRHATDGDDNIYISHPGGPEDSGTIRIGSVPQDSTYVAGIHGSPVSSALNEMTVLVDSSGRLGTQLSSRRFKEGIEDLGTVSRRLLDLRPVKFRYKDQEDRGPEQYGLLAEEVAAVFPELVVEDEEGEPYSVRYHILAPLLLNELQRAERERQRAERDLRAHRAELAALQERLSALERDGEPPPGRRPWWRRLLGGSP